METVNGSVEHITFHNQDTGFCVLQIINDEQKKICVVGKVISVAIGESCIATGNWIENKTYGRQLKAISIQLTAPSNLDNICKYLASGVIEGIGPKFAWRIVKHFGKETFDILDNHPERLKEVDGIGKNKLTKICSSWQSHSAMRETMLFLQKHNIGSTRAANIYKTYGNDTINIIRQNPYRLYSDIKGIGFKTADNIALSIGLGVNSILRAKAALVHILEEFSLNGHCAVPKQILLNNATETLNIQADSLTKALKEQLANNIFIQQDIDNDIWIYTYGLFYGELGTSQMLKRLNQGQHPLGQVDTQKALNWVQKKTGFPLAPSQQDAIIKGLTSKVFVITGGPGVGKTTLVNSLVAILKAKDLRVSLTAPTGRAAKRLSESTGDTAKTIHRLLEYEPTNGGFVKNNQSTLNTDVVVVDEVSMVDINLMYFLLRAIPIHAALILVGDVDQLPSVGPGSVLKDIIDSQTICTSQLTEIFRQESKSLIISNAHRINSGLLPIIDNSQQSDFFFIENNEPHEIAKILVDVVSTRLPNKYKYNPLTDIQVLTPMNHTPIGNIALNNALQQTLNPKHNDAITNAQKCFYVGDKVMQTQNNYDKDIFNGDIGFIKYHLADEKKIIINFDGENIEYNYSELDQITLAYACTIHKSQGSEYPVVVIPLHTQHYVMLQRNLIYTAITRGRSAVILIGSKKAMQMAIENDNSQTRYCALKHRLNGSLPEPIIKPLQKS